MVINGVAILAVLVPNWVWFLHSSLKLDILEATFFFSRPATKALHNAIHIGLKLGTNYKEGLKQGIDLRVRPSIGYQIFCQVINRVGKIADFGLK